VQGYLNCLMGQEPRVPVAATTAGRAATSRGSASRPTALPDAPMLAPALAPFRLAQALAPFTAASASRKKAPGRR
jgi:hypothetical protein